MRPSRFAPLGRPLIWPLLVLGLLASSLHADEKRPAGISNELVELYRVDQEDQERYEELSPQELAARQKARRDRTLVILARGWLEEPADYHYASWILQHGEGPDDFLLAHVLATTASFEGYQEAFFMSAAALDRFAMNLGQPQRFGSQYTDAAGQDLGDTSKLASEALVQVFRGSAAYDPSLQGGLRGRALEPEARSKKKLKAAARELSKLAKTVEKKARAAAEDPESKSAAELASALERASAISALGQLDQPADFFNAAQVLLHASDPDTLLDAHALATAAGLLEHKGARELYAQTLDRYLLALGRAPIFERPAANETPAPEAEPALRLHANVRAHFEGKRRKRR